ncbi:MAG TPA: response regulator [Blastocatellia bacterium]|nr:response regulator [Blastocatellia bacterium]
MGFDLDSPRIDKWSADVEQLLERCERASSHYDVLGLASSADSDDISRAFSHRVGMLQPAREGLQVSGSTASLNIEGAATRRSMLARLECAFGRVTLAYSVLSSRKRRSDYDTSLSPSPPTTNVQQVEPSGPLSGEAEPAGEAETDEVSNGNRRWDRRLNLYIAAQVTGYDRDLGRWQEPAETVDVSKLGITFRIRKHLAVGTIIHISLPMPTKLRMHDFDAPNYNCYAIVRRAEPSKKGVRLLAVELIGEDPPSGYLQTPWASFQDRQWNGSERRRKPRQPKDEVIWIEYFTESMRSIRREAARTENVSEGGMRVRIKSAPNEFEYARVSYPDGRLQTFAVLCDRYTGEDNFERLCLRFLAENELARAAAISLEPGVIALPGPDNANAGQTSKVLTSIPVAVERALPQVNVQATRASSFRRRRILIADDDGPLRKTLGKILNTAGYDVTLVEDGNAAIAKAATEQPDLVITDALMPKLHGFLVCKTLKGFNPPPKVIMLTAVYTKPGYKWEARDKYGVDDLLTKPFKVPELLAAIERQLSGIEAAHAQ